MTFFCYLSGYRCFKAVLFLTGFLFGLVIVFLICQVEDLLPQYGNVGKFFLSKAEIIKKLCGCGGGGRRDIRNGVIKHASFFTVHYTGISCLSGFLYGLICLLVPYVGFFTVGFHAGLLAGLASMIFFPWEYSVWISVLFLLG
jgi:hypothetical protein